MAKTNGFFGSLQGPFEKDVQLFDIIQEDCVYEVDYISKLGIHWTNNFDSDLNGVYQPNLLVRINKNEDNNNEEFQIGKTRMLELEDVHITSIQFVNDTDDTVYIDYQYQKKV